MENKIKKLWVGLLVVLVIAIIGVYTPSSRNPVTKVVGAIVDTSFFDYFDAYTGYKINGTTFLTSSAFNPAATNTIAASYDGFVANGTFTMATGTAKAVYTNTHSPAACFGTSGSLYVRNNGSFAPSLVFGLGTSTSATGYSTNLLASTTIATTTTTFTNTLTSGFILGSGESIVGAISDITNTIASSTYYGNWSAEFKVSCSQIDI